MCVCVCVCARACVCERVHAQKATMFCHLLCVQKALDLKHLAGHNWVDPPKRERKNRVNYSENEYFKGQMKVGALICMCVCLCV